MIYYDNILGFISMLQHIICFCCHKTMPCFHLLQLGWPAEVEPRRGSSWRKAFGWGRPVQLAACVACVVPLRWWLARGKAGSEQLKTTVR